MTDNTTHEGMQPLQSKGRMRALLDADTDIVEMITLWRNGLRIRLTEADWNINQHEARLRNEITALTDQLREAERQLADLQERDELLVKRTHENTIDLVEENRQLKVERDELTDQLREARATKDELISVVQLAYRKHHLEDSRIGWDELSDRLLDALSNAMGAEELVKWQEDNNDE